jgi:uncharacterized protein (TIGR03067 family)
VRPARLLLLILSAALVGFAPAPFPKAERRRADPADVAGVWVFVRSESNGRLDPPDSSYTLEMTRERCVFVHDRTGPNPFQMRLDPTAVPPSFTWGTNGNVGYVGSYRLQGDELTMIFTIGGQLQQRPTDFTAPPYKYVLRRVRRN